MDERQQDAWAAPCGLYCGACTIRLAGKRGDASLLEQIAEVLSAQRGYPIERVEDLTCEGCLSPNVVAVVCRDCVLRSCALEKGINLCSQCTDFPCQQIIDFNNDGLPHHGEVLDSIRRQQQIGCDAWMEEQETRWRCPHCGGATDWYAAQCPECGSALTPQFGPPQT